MNAEKLAHAWSMDSLLLKAQRYASIMLEKERTDWQFGFFSTLTLEFLGRAALAKFSPTLLARTNDWNNIYYSLGYNPTKSKFVPRSIDIGEVFKRLNEILPEFKNEDQDFCTTHLNLRNKELHSGELAFDGIGTTGWLPKYYRTSQILLKSVGKKLDYLIGKDEAKLAELLIKSLNEKVADEVRGTIKEHKEIWKSLDKKEQSLKTKQANALATKFEGHRVICPSCKSTALLQGSPMGPPQIVIEDETILEKQSMLPYHFECFACELKITGFSKLNTCNLGDAFTASSRYHATDYFDIDQSSDMYYEEDFNE